MLRRVTTAFATRVRGPDATTLAARIRAASNKALSKAEATAAAVEIRSFGSATKVKVQTGDGFTLFFHEGRAYLNLKEKLGKGEDKKVYRALQIDPVAGTAVAVAHIKYKKGDGGEDLLRRSVDSDYIAKPNHCTFEYLKDGKRRVVGYAPLYGDNLETAYSSAEAKTRRHFLTDAACGLRDLHAAGIIHRDVKADNFLVDGDCAVLADLGRSTREADGIGGQLMDLSPEACRDDRQTMESDVWSFGLMMYRLSTDETPEYLLRRDELEGDWFLASMAEVSQREVDAFWPEEMDSALKPIIQGCLQVDPKERWSMDRVVEALEALAPKDEVV